MRWQPECGWATFAVRWAVAGGAGVFLAVSAATATGSPGAAVPQVDAQDVRPVELAPDVRADLARIAEHAAPPDRSADDESPDGDSDDSSDSDPDQDEDQDDR